MSTAPAGFAPIFPGWNVWSVYQSDDPIEGVLGTIWTLGESLDRKLQVWVEDHVKDTAPGTAVADPANPAALRGDQVFIIPSAGTLDIDSKSGDIPELSGAMQLGNAGSKAVERYVRFYNRGAASVMPWPHDTNYLLNHVYSPSGTDPITSSKPPASLSSALDAAGNAAEKLVEFAAVGIGAYLLWQAFRK